jgi:hypothetical protein
MPKTSLMQLRGDVNGKTILKTWLEAQISLIGQQGGKYASETYGPRCIGVFRKFYG